jgi:predicted nuclease of predicted toxin-antitoxin system
VKFLVDNQLPTALTRFLASHGHDAEHVLDLRMDEADDRSIWTYVTSQKSVLITKDSDFLHLANRTGSSGSLIWVRIPNCRKAALLAAFERALPAVIDGLNAGDRVVELR